jgi:hypothetical protein
MTYLSMGAVQADAVFVSRLLQRCDELSAGQVRQAVAAAVRAFGRSGCAGRVAQEFGDHPDTACSGCAGARRRPQGIRGLAARARPRHGRRVAGLSARGGPLSRRQAHQPPGGVGQPEL